ncbi:multi-sensor hybrid histidine kinase [Planoprotostelium fungivorum]|uniref:Multi-sensor hybrid histidine kinase n=1 Tax=Planoprotostelium fungivorum TaxID=1890364 RepID=A0A2P6N307_9EUKA|nr:multi-sensor hybrid histidine kinase [Planoprotostelium fungivorum]
MSKRMSPDYVIPSIPLQVVKPLKSAISNRYSMVDTATIYDNEKEIGPIIPKDLFVTTKLWRSHQGSEIVITKQLNASEKKLGKKIDLWLLHWPGPGKNRFKGYQVPQDWTSDMRIETMKTMVKLQREGRVRAVGVSNFNIDHLKHLKEKAGITPAVNQIELHPFLDQLDLLRYCRDEGIVIMAYSSLGAGDSNLLGCKEVKEISRRHGRTPAQVLLRWATQHGAVILPSSQNVDHIEENARVWDFELTEEEMNEMDTMGRGKRYGWKENPDAENERSKLRKVKETEGLINDLNPWLRKEDLMTETRARAQISKGGTINIDTGMEVVYPEDEAERLLELRRYEILDTAPEPEFDRITTLLKRVLGTTLATIVLVDRDRHWVKSCCVTDLVGVSVPRGGFCSRTILSNQIHMVTDAHLLPVGQEYGISFYAGAPLTTKNGRRIGTLCCANSEPRPPLTEEEMSTLQDLAALTVQSLELRLTNANSSRKLAKQRDKYDNMKEDIDRLLSGLNTFPEGLFMWNCDDSTMAYVNQGFQQITGYNYDDVVHVPGDVSRFFVGQGRETEIEESFRQMTRDVTLEMEGVRRDGSVYWMSLHVAPILGSDSQCYRFGVLLDITPRKQTELELIQSKSMAQEAIRVKSAFLANVSHEIRTPLNAICASTDLLMSSHQSTEHKELTRMIQSGATSLMSLIEDIFDFREIESNRIELSPSTFLIRKCMEDVIDVSYLRAHGKQLYIEFSIEEEVPSLIETDEARLRQVLTKLINNAITFTNQGGIDINVSIRDEDPTSHHIQFDVRDTGIGIREENLDKLFQSFTQVDVSRTRRYGGTGLGLAFCKHLVCAMGGDIWLQSKYSVGSTFSFTIKVDKNKSRKDILRAKRHCIVLGNDIEKRSISSLARDACLVPRICENDIEAAELISRDEGLDLLLIGPSYEGKPVLTNVTEIHMLHRRQINQLIMMSVAPSVCITYPLHLSKLTDRLSLFDKRGVAVQVKPHRVQPSMTQVKGRIELLRSREEERKMMPPSLHDIPSLKRKESPLALSVLVAEDNPVNQRVMCRLLNTMGVDPILVNNGREAVEQVQQNHFDVILMDLQMPEMDGLTASQTIQSMTEIHRPIIIAVTADVLHGIEDKCREKGMNGYIAKPIKRHQIRDVLDKISSGDTGPEGWMIFS